MSNQHHPAAVLYEAPLFAPASTNFKEYFNTEELHDLIIVIEKGEKQTRFYAHKLILAMTSPFFKS